MTDTPFGPLESLVGRTFEKDGKRLRVAGLFDANVTKKVNTCTMDGHNTIGVETWDWFYLSAWLRGAREVTQ